MTPRKRRPNRIKKECRIKVGYSMPEESLLKIEKFCADTNTKQSDLLEKAIIEHLEKNK